MSLLRRSYERARLAPFATISTGLLLAGTTLALPFAAAQTCTTSITGKVYSPLGQSGGGDPIPNILVYVPTTAVQPLPAGVSSCAVAGQLVSGNPLVSTTTAADGSFVLTSPGLATMSPFTIVIQAGKWRRQYTNVTAPPCALTPVPSMAMPANKQQGDLPHIAISTGAADSVECIFKKIGISTSEFTLPSGTGSINLYEGGAAGATGNGGQASPDSTGATGTNPTPSDGTLLSSPASLANYDVMMFGCQGTASVISDTTANLQNLVNFANIGGRVFTTHYGYVWLEDVQPFASAATWLATEAYSGTSAIATIDQTYPEGAILAQWVQNVGASYNNTLGQVALTTVRVDTSGVNNPPAQSWVKLNGTFGGIANPSMQFTFDTPVNATTTPTVALAFTNTPAKFLLGDTADTITIVVTNNSGAAADSSLNLSLTLPTGLTAVSLTGVGGSSGWLCSAASLVCNRSVPLGAGSSDPIVLVVSISNAATLGPGTLSAAIAGGGLSGTNQCGRVLFNDYHVETPITKANNASIRGDPYPSDCSTGSITAQEKFLEFSLYNLSNFVAPVTTDAISIQAVPVITWPTPAPLASGKPLTALQLDATASVPGTFVYSPAAGVVPTLGLNTLSVTFTPTDVVSYTTATATVQLIVYIDMASATLVASPEPSIAGNLFNMTATFVPPVNGPPATGTVTFTADGIAAGSATIVGGAATTTQGPATLTIGTGHTLSAQYSGDSNYLPSTTTGTHTVTGRATAVVLALCVQGSTTFPCPAVSGTMPPLITPLSMFYGQNLDGTATTASIDGSVLSATSTVTFLDNGVAFCTIPVVPNSQCPASAGTGVAAGTHLLTATYNGDATHLPSTSNIITVNVLPDPTQSALGTSLNPAPLAQLVTFTDKVTGNYAIPTGQVAFLDGTTTIRTAPLDATGTAQFAISTLIVGLHQITAVYTPLTNPQNFLPSTSGLINELITFVPSPVPTSTLLASSWNPSAVTKAVTFTAAVASSGPFVKVPAGTVTFLDGTTALGMGTLDSRGIATFTTTSLALGSHTITASYPGDKTTIPSVSAVLVQVVDQGLKTAVPAFSVTATPTTMTLGTGRSAAMLVTVTPISGFNQPVALTCTGLPNETACTFGEATMPAGGGTTTLQLSTIAPHDCGSAQPYFVGGNGGLPSTLPFGLPILAGLVVFGITGRRRLANRLTSSLIAMVALGAMLQLTGCGTCTDLGTLPGNYTFQVTGTAGSEVETQVINLTVTVP
jgi:hypothetical protein